MQAREWYASLVHDRVIPLQAVGLEPAAEGEPAVVEMGVAVEGEPAVEMEAALEVSSDQPALEEPAPSPIAFPEL